MAGASSGALPEQPLRQMMQCGHCDAARGLAIRLLVLLLFWAFPAVAQIQGASEPAFAQAFGTWIAADEAQALPAMARLAGQGNGAAQLFLGMIDSTAVLQGDWLMQQDRQSRIALLRPPGGISGGSWLRVAAKTDAVAATWLRLWDSAATPQVVIDFAKLTEPRAARVAALALAARQVKGFAEVAGQPDFPQVLQVFAIQEWRNIAPQKARDALAALPEGDPQSVFFTMPAGRPALVDWLGNHADGDSLVAFCSANCASEPSDACLAATFEAIGGYHHGLMRLGSPFEALIASHAFNRSAEGLAVTLRRMQQRQSALGKPAIPAGSACIAEALK